MRGIFYDQANAESAGRETMETFKPKRLEIEVRPLLFIGVVSAFFIWAIFPAVRPRVSGSGEYIGAYKKVDLKALGYFNFDNVDATIDNVPATFRKLDGQKVALQGYTWSPSSSPQVNDFQLISGFKFNGPPLAQQRVFAHSPVPLTCVGDECRVLGTLHIRIEKNEDGEIISVYTMDVDKWQEM